MIKTNDISRDCSNTINIISLIVAAIVSSIYLLMLGWFNAPALDDYGYIYMVEEKGVWGMMATAYNGWQCRFSTFLVNGTIMLLFGRASNLILVTILMLMSGWLLAERLLTGIFRKYGIDVPKLQLVCLAVLVVNVSLMAYLEPATFFWLSALNYTISVWMTVLIVYSLFYSEARLWLRWTGAIVASLYISGTAENYTPLVILVLGVVWLGRLIQQRKERPWKEKTNIMLFVSLMIMGVGFLVMLLGPGNSKRLGNGTEGEMAIVHLTLGGLFVTTIKASAILLLRLFSRSYYYLLLFPVFCGIGANCKRSIVGGKPLLFNCLGILALLVLFIVIAVAACVAGMGWYAPPRAFSYMSFVLTIVCAVLAFSIGRRIKKKGLAHRLSFVSCSFLSVVVVVMMLQDFPMAKSYHDYVAGRNAQIAERVAAEQDNLEESPEPFVCQPYGKSWKPNTYSVLRNVINSCMGKSSRYYEPQMLLMESELGNSPDDWRNIDVKNYFHADFDIVCVESEDLP